MDPTRAHLGRAQLLRAIEVALLTGERLSELHASKARPSLYSPSYLLVDPGMELQSRIASRASAMFEAGWLDEVRALMDTVPEDAPAWNATGYGVVRELARGTLDRETALAKVVIGSRQYAKRQRTWFRHQLERDRVHRLAPYASGWQEGVERWVNTVEESMRT
jgi:tRNA dimethylallyltransferase